MGDVTAKVGSVVAKCAFCGKKIEEKQPYIGVQVFEYHTMPKEGDREAYLVFNSMGKGIAFDTIDCMQKAKLTIAKM